MSELVIQLCCAKLRKILGQNCLFAPLADFWSNFKASRETMLLIFLWAEPEVHLVYGKSGVYIWRIKRLKPIVVLLVLLR